MGLVSAIAALCKAVPILERLLFSVADAVKEAKAKARFEAKLDHIDDAINRSRWWERMPIGGVQQHRGIDQSPAVSGGSDKRTSVDEGSTSQDS